MPTFAATLRILRNHTRNVAGQVYERALRPMLPVTDDYGDWADYRRHYEKDLADHATLHTQKLTPADFDLIDGAIQLCPGLKPLHPNHSALYETIGALTPRDVIEIGCGGGDHLHNLGVLFPNIDRHGVDVSQGQLELLRERSPHLASLVQWLDITEPLPREQKPADVVYTQAVIMHIQRKGAHLGALANMFTLTRRQVVLMENRWRHWFMDDIAMLHRQGRIGWPSVHFYFRRHQDRPILMVISHEPLAFEPLTDYRTLLDAVDWRPHPRFRLPDGRYRP